jgi:hypothetical protein
MVVEDDPLPTAEIVCPVCQYQFDMEDQGSFITLHGSEAGPHEDCCPNCDAQLSIEEIVTRSYVIKLANTDST